MDKQKRRNIDRLASLINQLVFNGKEIPLETALENAGIDIKYFNDEVFDGFLKWDSENDRPVISVNANHPEVRRNFSMAHELGHLVMGYHWIPYDPENVAPEQEVMNVTKYRGGSYTKKEKPEEYLVNEFAAAFLVPDDQLRRIIEDTDIKEVGYQGLLGIVSDKFDVSIQAASIRVENFLDLQETKS